MKAIVQQIGARMEYAVPRALSSAGYLQKLVTDLYFHTSPSIGRLKNYSAGLPKAKVSSNNLYGLGYRAIVSYFPMRAWPHLLAAESIATRTCDLVEKTSANLFYGFDTAMLPSMDRLRRTGALIVMEQCIAPRKNFLSALSVLEGKLKSLGIETGDSGLDQTEAYFSVMAAMESEEWSRTDRIYCPSLFVRDALVVQGVPSTKIQVIPYGVTIAPHEKSRRNECHKPRVVFGGSFSWRKGALEFGRLASEMSTEAVFEVYGTNLIPKHITQLIAPHVQQCGHLQKSSFHAAIAEADIFVLPSYMEGSATVVYEAMAMGLACVVTHQCGSVITNGVDGLIIEAGDDYGLQEAVKKLLHDRDARREMGLIAMQTAKAHTRESYGKRVVVSLEEDLAAFRRSGSRV